jgi:pyruvate dehydrogenase E1 component beta subunit
MAKQRIIQAINDALMEEMARDPKLILFGEDVEISLFGDTRGLHSRFGPARVRNTPISENLLTGMAVGAAAAGYRVIAHLMFGTHPYRFRFDRQPAAKLRFMTAGRYAAHHLLGRIGGGKSTPRSTRTHRIRS